MNMEQYLEYFLDETISHLQGMRTLLAKVSKGEDFIPPRKDKRLDDKRKDKERVRDKDKVRKLNGYNVYLMSRSKVIKKARPDISLGQVSKIVSHEWSELKDEEKKKFQQEATDRNRANQEKAEGVQTIKKEEAIKQEEVEPPSEYRLVVQKPAPQAESGEPQVEEHSQEQSHNSVERQVEQLQRKLKKLKKRRDEFEEQFPDAANPFKEMVKRMKERLAALGQEPRKK